jgi:hypothetical protein
VIEPSPRQVLYALVAAGFLLVVAVLVVAAGVTGLVPVWWTAATAVGLTLLSIWCAVNWRRTGPVLAGAVAYFLIWAIGTSIVAS